MHEMSIAMSVIDSVLEKARQESALRVTRIEMVVGRLAGVQVESLKFCFSAAARETIAEDAELVVEERAAAGVCDDCGMSFPVEVHYAPCPGCGRFRVTIVTGEELSIQSITID